MRRHKGHTDGGNQILAEGAAVAAPPTPPHPDLLEGEPAVRSASRLGELVTSSVPLLPLEPP